MSVAPRPAAAWTRFAPIGRWLPGYERACLPPDVLAGLALWAVMVPEGMAYAGIVGVPAIMGLYTLVPPLAAYALFGTSRRLVVGPDTATGVISALTVGALAAKGSADFVALTSTLAVLIGVFFLAFGALRLGWVSAFIANPVMRGFIEGLIGVTIIGQVANLLGLHGISGDFFAKLTAILGRLHEISAPSAAVGLASLAAMLVMRRISPRLPAALVVAVAATIASRLMHLESLGVEVVEHLPSGLPHLTPPRLDPQLLASLAPGALSIVLVGYAEALGAAKAAASGGEAIDANQELTAHGLANVLSGLFGGFLAVGSLSKTSVAIGAGARTQVANLVAALLCFLTLVFLTPLFKGLPHPALAAIVIAAMLHLSKPSYLRQLAAQAPFEFAMAVVVIVGVLALGVLQGIALGVVISLLLLIYRTSHPTGAVEGKLPGEEAYRDVQLHPEAQTFPGLLIFNPGGALFFASVGAFERELRASIARAQAPVRQVLIDASAVAFVDSSAAEVLLALVKDLKADGVAAAFARVRDPVRATLQKAGIVEAVGPAAFHDRLTGAVSAFLGREP
ncbi:MAG TPA: SulP family inorganic anion transporter [Phenylobacterium sp.]|uniref:SulP family inorganic anion transporter n=1 Tax=Phenylobacterium sp. TaxID=1871053 RepID=UPI002B4A95BF|nr:SulP family inorganic anion transporter [Phenylobacterium sp.]HKR88197.1 SulP family inorganic anion transporter [Phenylobacterium sp.]